MQIFTGYIDASVISMILAAIIGILLVVGFPLAVVLIIVSCVKRRNRRHNNQSNNNNL